MVAVWWWAGCLTSLNSRFLTFKIGILLPLKVFVRFKDGACTSPSTPGGRLGLILLHCLHGRFNRGLFSFLKYLIFFFFQVTVSLPWHHYHFWARLFFAVGAVLRYGMFSSLLGWGHPSPRGVTTQNVSKLSQMLLKARAPTTEKHHSKRQFLQTINSIKCTEPLLWARVRRQEWIGV